MNVYRAFGMVRTKFVRTMQPSAMYALSAGSCPEAIRDDFIERAESGEPIAREFDELFKRLGWQ